MEVVLGAAALVRDEADAVAPQDSHEQSLGRLLLLRLALASARVEPVDDGDLAKVGQNAAQASEEGAEVPPVLLIRDAIGVPDGDRPRLGAGEPAEDLAQLTPLAGPKVP
ncbi:MAG: hypothetical protein RMK90_12150, partial [Acetobacteraceae bacterium]|nr:hypothetical protein [Acetobacteraceae bacterium]